MTRTMQWVVAVLFCVSVSFAGEIKRPTVDANDGSAVQSDCAGGTNQASLAMGATHDTDPNTSSSNAAVGTLTATRWKQRKFTTWESPSGAYNALTLNIKYACTTSPTDTTTGGSCGTSYSTDGGNNWTSIGPNTDGGIHTDTIPLSAGQNLANLQVRICVVGNQGFDVNTTQGSGVFDGYDIWTDGTVGPPPPPPPPTASTTFYQYDALDNLTRVEQRGGDSNPSHWRVRTFVYDSLSRLITATNPESGAICYGVWSAGQCVNGYDVDGNLLAQTDARNITISQTYDQLHRLTGKTYSNGEAGVTNCYDLQSCTTLPIGNGVGRRINMTDGSGSSAWSYDSMGRVTAARQTILGVTKTINYQYNQAGSPTRITYPSGRIIEYDYSVAGRPLFAKDVANVVNYAQNAAYAPHGALKSVLLGNDHGNGGSTLTQTFNKRLQPLKIRATTSSRTIIDLNYDFNLNVANNGNVKQITNNRVPDHSRDLAYTYDELNRLKTAQSGAVWCNRFDYDPWGNLLGKILTCGTGENTPFTVDAANHVIGNSYDPAGDVTGDGINTYTYNAEGDVTSSAGITFTYDGDGQRVGKSGYRLYWWGMGGNGPFAETFTSGGAKREYIYFADRRVAMVDLSVSGNNCQGIPPDCARYYFYPDHLGSTAVLATTGGGTTVFENDYYPFGGERNPPVTSSSIDPHYKFTGKELDSETGLYYFGARYLSTRLGRFTSPDEPFADQDEADPQSWNLYSYVRNNPINNLDPDGQSCIVGSDGSAVDVPTIPMGESCAEIAAKKKTDKPNAVVTPSYNQEERIQLLGYYFNNMFSPHSIADFTSQAGRETLRVTNPVLSNLADCAIEGCSIAQASINFLPIPGLARGVLLGKVKHPKLRKLINELYRPGAKIGTGSTADAIREELRTGANVGKSHLTKGEQYSRALEKLLRDPSLTGSDRELAAELWIDLRNALRGK